MRYFNLKSCVAAAVILAVSIAGGALADKGGGGHGDRGGNRGDHGGGQAAHSGRDGGPSGRASRDSGSDRQVSPRSFSSPKRAEGGQRSFSREFSPPIEGNRAPRSVRSFYRGPDAGTSGVEQQFRGPRGDEGRRDFEGHRDFERNRGWDGDWRRNADQVRRDWRDRDHHDLPFRYGWWDGYANHWPVYGPWRYSRWRDRPYYWWSWTTAPRLIAWLAFDGNPRYWEYGPGRNIYYRDNYVYYDDRQFMTADDYYQQVYDLAHDIPNVDQATAEQMDWSPLGVFALMGQNESQGSRLLQLAINRDGILSGTYYNQQSGTAHPVAGRVDKRTQRAAWAFADGQNEEVVFETSLYSLTASDSSMMVHFGPGADAAEVWRMVRLEQPNSTATGTLPTPSQPLPQSQPTHALP